MVGFEFTCPEGKTEQKYFWLLKLEHAINEENYNIGSLVSATKTAKSKKVTIQTILFYQE
jgi:hypothetical protein